VVFRFPVATTSRLLSAMMDLVHCGPGPALSLILWNPLLLVTLLDMLRLPFLLVSVFRFVTAWHEALLSRRDYLVQRACPTETDFRTS
jgi:hypothetical protein